MEPSFLAKELGKLLLWLTLEEISITKLIDCQVGQEVSLQMIKNEHGSKFSHAIIVIELPLQEILYPPLFHSLTHL